MRLKHFAKINYFNFLKSNVVMVFHYLVFLISFVFGSLTVMFGFSFKNESDFTALLMKYFEQDYLSCFFNHLIFGLIVLSVIYLLSFYPFGAPLTVCAFSLFALCIGCFVTAVCKYFGFKGVLINLSVFIIPFASLVLVYALISSASISFSSSMASITFLGKTVIDIRQKTKDLFVLYIILIIVTVLISLLISFLTMLISGFITN